VFFLSPFTFHLSPVFAESSASVQAAFLRGEFDSVSQRTAVLLEQKRSDADQLLYLQGVARLKLRDWTGAERSLQELIKRYPKSKHTPYARLALGATQKGAGDLVGATNSYQLLLKDRTAQAVWPQATYELGQLQRQMGLWEQAKVSLKKVGKDLIKKESFHFTVQVGAFTERRNAKRLLAELKERQFNGVVSLTQVSGRQFYRVRVGQFSSRLDAEREAGALRKAGFPAKVVP